MTEEIKARIDRLVGEYLELKQVVEEAEEKMRTNRQELGRIMRKEGKTMLGLGHAVLKLIVTRTTWDWDYIKSLPGYDPKKAIKKVRGVPIATIWIPKSKKQS